jgi:hypothetical protein
MNPNHDSKGRFARGSSGSSKSIGPKAGSANRANIKARAAVSALKGKAKTIAKANQLADGPALGKAARGTVKASLQASMLKGNQLNPKQVSKWQRKLTTADRTAVSKKLALAGNPNVKGTAAHKRVTGA